MHAINKIFTLMSLTLLVTQVHSQSFIAKENDNPKQTAAYWTPERLKNAMPYPLPTASLTIRKDLRLQQIKPKTGPVMGRDGVPPVGIKTTPKRLFYPDPHPYQHKSLAALNRGTSNEDFSSTQLVPLTADLSYPYSTVGMLYLTGQNGIDSVCSASVIQDRIVLSARHCVHDGTNSPDGYNTNFIFIPAIRDGVAPFETWTWTYALVPFSFKESYVTNGNDYGLLEMADQSINGTLTKLGKVTGELGYQTYSLMPNHVNMIGYPCNLDQCQKMHQVTAQSIDTTSDSTVEYGTDMGGGSSGSPWIQNFGVQSLGQTDGINTAMNRVVGVTSYGYGDIYLSQGSPILDQNFVNLLTTMCNHQAGNCS